MQVNHSRYTTQCAPKYPDDAKSYAHLSLALLICYSIPMIVIIICSGTPYYQVHGAAILPMFGGLCVYVRE